MSTNINQLLTADDLITELKGLGVDSNEFTTTENLITELKTPTGDSNFIDDVDTTNVQSLISSLKSPGTSPSNFKALGINPNSTANKFDLATDDMGKEFYSTLGMLADIVGAEETAKDFRATSEEFRKARESKPQPDISMSITEESSKIYDRFSRGEILGGIADTAEFVHSAIIGAGPSLLATGAAVGAGAVAAPFLSAGDVHDEAIKYGASEREAQAIGLGAGTAIGLLDRIGFGFLINGLTKKFGKDITLKTIKEQTNLPEKTIKEAIDSAEDITKQSVIKDALKGVGKGALGEGITEGTQSIVQNVSPTLVSDKEIKSHEILKDFIDSAAVGGLAGGTLRGTLSGASTSLVKQSNRIVNDNEAVIEKIIEDIPENNKLLEDESNFVGPPTLEDIQIQEERAKIEGKEKIVDVPRPKLTRDAETKTVYDFDQDIEALGIERDKLRQKEKELKKQKKKLSKEEKDRLNEITRSLRNRRGGTSNNTISQLVSRSTAPLQRLANTSPVTRSMVQDLVNFFVETNQEIGGYYRTKELINDRIRKQFKLPFQSSIPKKIKTEVANQLNYKDYNSTNPDVVIVAQQIRDEILDPLYIRLKASGVDIGRVDEYLTRIFKIRPIGLGRKKDINKFTEILNRNGLNGQIIMDNILENDGLYVPEKDVNILLDNVKNP